MDAKPKSIWKKSWTGWRGLLLGWLILMVILLVCLLFLVALTGTPAAKSGEELRLLGVIGLVVTLVFLLAAFIHWLCCWRNLKRSLFGLACFATLIALFYAEENWRGKRAWEKFRHEWEAKGEHFDFASVVPPPVPDAQNFALTPVVASCYERILDKNGKRVNDTNVVNRLEFDLGDDYGYRTNGRGNWTSGTMADLNSRLELFAAKTNLFSVPSPIQSPAHDVLQVLGKFAATVEELRQASQLPESRFPLNYDTECPAAILLPQLAAMKSSIQLLQLRTLAELQNGQPEKALADVKLMLRLIEAIRTEPFLISQLVRIAMWQITLQPIYEGLAEHRWSDAELVAMDAEVEKMDFLTDYKFSIRGEIGLHSGIVEYLRRHPGELANMTSDRDQGGNSSSAPARFFPDGWFYQNLLRSSRFMVLYYLPTIDLKQRAVSKSLMRQADEAFGEEIRHITPYNFLERVLLPALGSAAKKFANAQSSVDLARTAIALERYRLAHGEFPDSLDALAPQFLEKIPHDVIGGQPLKYRREAGGQFVLYSVGWNEKDDGGVVIFKKGSSSEVDINQGDWVWRYPAK